MGGNVFKESVRLNKEELFRSFNLIKSDIKKEFPNSLIDYVPFYRNKSSFGDLDILTNIEMPKLYEIILRIYPKAKTSLPQPLDYPKEISMLFENKYQVDFIFADTGYYDFSHNYHSWNVLSSLLGIISRMLGVKVKQEGLFYTVYCKNRKVDILITTNFYEVLELLDYSAALYKKGFDSPEDIFNFVTTSKYYNKSLFYLENRSQITRSRDIKRDLYVRFVEYVKSNNFEINEFPWKKLPKGEYETNEQNSFFLKILYDRYPNFKKDLEREKDICVNILLKKQDNKEKINTVISELHISNKCFSGICRNLALNGINIKHIFTEYSSIELINLFKQNLLENETCRI